MTLIVGTPSSWLLGQSDGDTPLTDERQDWRSEVKWGLKMWILEIIISLALMPWGWMRSQRKHTEEGRREEKTQSNRHVLFSSVSVHSNFLVPPPHLLFNQPPSPTLCSTGEANFGCPVHTCLPPAPRWRGCLTSPWPQRFDQHHGNDMLEPGPSSPQVASYQQLKVSLSGDIYTTEIGKHCKSNPTHCPCEKSAYWHTGGCGQNKEHCPADLIYRSQKRCSFSFWIANCEVCPCWMFLLCIRAPLEGLQSK